MAVNGLTARLLITGAIAAASGLVASVPAQADTFAYLVNVTVRPGYNFPGGDALGYGYGLCDRVAHGLSYPQLIGGVKADFNNDDEYQAVYLINQAVNELCPAQIWQLRQVAAHYRGPTAPAPFPQG